MSEIPDYTTGTTPVVTTTEPVAEHTVVTTAENKPNRLYQAAAWVAIVAGTLFIVAVIFFSGFILGRHSGGPGHFGGHGWQHGMMERQNRDGWGGPGMMRPGGPDQGGPGPGNFGPGPGNFGPGGPGGPGGTPPTPPTR
ncbi:MAG TPA: hypothetical protein VIU87_06670 [Mycobacterium sp.]